MKYRGKENTTIQKGFDYLCKRGKDKGGFEKGVDVIDTVGRYANHFEAITNGSVKIPQTGTFFSNLNNDFGNILLHFL